MEIKKKLEDKELTLALKGRLDTVTAPELEKELADTVGVKKITLDLKDLEYISSAGLRVILATYKSLSAKGGELVLVHCNQVVKEVFDITGLADVLNIK